MADSGFIKKASVIFTNQYINFLFLSQAVCTSRKLLIILYSSYTG